MAESGLFSQNVIAVIWDFDKTLIPEYMQKPLFEKFHVDAKLFWREVNALPEIYRKKGAGLVSQDTIYLNHILNCVRHGVFPGLSNAMLRELGASIEFYPGLPRFFDSLREMIAGDPKFASHEIALEHYIVSTGLRQMILGSRIAPAVDGVWGCEFAEGTPAPGFLSGASDDGSGEITDIAYSVDNTSKTRAVFEINKGSNKHPEIDVNSLIRPEDRRVPFENMVYIADGPSDIPVFSLIRQKGGRTYGVYQKGNIGEFEQVRNLQKQGRIDSFGEADYTEGSQTTLWLSSAVSEIAATIAAKRERMFQEKVGQPPRHLNS